MNRSTLFFLASAALVAPACADDGTVGPKGADGKAGKPGEIVDPSAGSASSLSLVTPGKGILDRELEVSIGGIGTTFDAASKPSFGDGIEVLEVTASTPTLLTAKIRIAKDAVVGPRAVTVGETKADKAFAVIPAINVVVPDGDPIVPQGGLIQFAIENNDSRAFDPSAFKLDAGDLIDIGSEASGPQNAVGFLLAPPLAKPGTNRISVANLDASGKERVSFLSAADAVSVKARAATPFASSLPSVQTFVGGLDSKLFALTSPANETAIVDYRVEVAPDATTLPVAFVFGTGGGKSDRLGQVLPARNSLTGEFAAPPYDLHVGLPIASTASATDHWLVLADLRGTPGSKATVTASRVAATAATESPAAHGSDAPQVLGAVTPTSGRVVSGTLAAASELDAYKLTVGADAKLQLVATSDADLEIVLTKDPAVLEDPQGTPPAERKVLGYIYPGKELAASRTLTAAVGSADVYVLVLADSQGSVKTGPYTLGLRKLP